MAKSVDALDLDSSGVIRGSSILPTRTILRGCSVSGNTAGFQPVGPGSSSGIRSR